jgi:hypothetical protein
VDIYIAHEELHEPEGLGLALARRRTRLRAGFVVHNKTDFRRAAGDKPAALFFCDERAVVSKAK